MFLVISMLIILSGSFFIGTIKGKNAEQMIPITIMSIVAILFVFGFFGALRVGLYVVCITALTLYVVSIYYMRKQNNWNNAKEVLLSPGVIVFAGYSIIFFALNVGKIASQWDEFSHWMDSVSAMVYINDFVANPSSHSAFRYYPPGMTLFQYFLAKLNTKTLGVNGFTDWVAYYGYQAFSFSLFMPFLSKERVRHKSDFIIIGLIFLLMPLFLFRTFFEIVYIDAFVGLLAGSGICAIIYWEDKDWIYATFIALACMILTLAKEAGLYFAIIIGIMFCIDQWKYRIRNIRNAIISFLGVFSAIATKIVWTIVTNRYDISTNNVSTINVKEYIKLFFFHRGTDYKQTTVDNFKEAFFSRFFVVGNTGLEISYFTLSVVLLITVLYLYKNFENNVFQAFDKTNVTMSFLMTIVYVFFLGATYAFNFSEDEATKLASYERYMNMSYLSLLCVVVIGFIVLFTEKDESHRLRNISLLLAVVILVSPMNSFMKFLDRSTVKSSIDKMEPYNSIVANIKEACTLDDSIEIISQEDNGSDFWHIRYSSRPVYVSDWKSLGEPFYNGDAWTKMMTVDEWGGYINERGITCVALYHLNDYFFENYSALFENPDDIAEGSIYRFDSNDGLLRRCQ